MDLQNKRVSNSRVNDFWIVDGLSNDQHPDTFYPRSKGRVNSNAMIRLYPSWVFQNKTQNNPEESK